MQRPETTHMALLCLRPSLFLACAAVAISLLLSPHGADGLASSAGIRTPSHRVVVTFKKGKSLAETSIAPQGAGPRGPKSGHVLRQDGHHAVLAVEPGDIANLAELRGHHAVQSVEMDLSVGHGQAAIFMTDLTLKGMADGLSAPGTNWQLSTDESFSAWHATATVPAGTVHQTIGILDSGMPCAPAAGQTFPAGVRTATGYDFVSDPLLSLDGDGRDANPTDPGDAGLACPSSSWHGFQTSAMAYAAAHSSNVAIQPIRVLGQCGKGYASDLADAITWGYGGSVSGIAANPTPNDVLLLAVSGYGACPSFLQASIDAANAAGAQVVVAAGNNGASVGAYFPANCLGVISAGASTRYGDLAWCVDVVGGGSSSSSRIYLFLRVDGGRARAGIATSGPRSRSPAGTRSIRCRASAWIRARATRWPSAPWAPASRLPSCQGSRP